MTTFEPSTVKTARQPSPSDAPEISVCICSSGRPTLTATIKSVLEQKLGSGCNIEITIVDNSPNATCRHAINELQSQTPANVQIKYVRDSRNNLSHIRNSAVSSSSGDYLAFLDDDEVARADWLEQLLTPIRTGCAEITIGEVLSEYSETCPEWISAGRLLDKFKFPDGTKLAKGHTASAMMSRRIAEQYPFDPKFGQSGDEDTDLFYRMHLDGYRIQYCKNAVVTEFNSPSRENWEYLRKSNISTGQCYARIIFPRLSTLQKLLAVLLVTIKSAGFLALTLLFGFNKGRRSLFWLRTIRNFTKLKWMLNARHGMVRQYCT